jgi:hypothetical protein
MNFLLLEERAPRWEDIIKKYLKYVERVWTGFIRIGSV